MKLDAISAYVDLDLERCVLGQMLEYALWPDFDEVGLRPDDFYRQEHALVWEAAAAVHDAGGAADLITVNRQLRVKSQLDRVGAADLAAMVQGVARPRAANILLAVSNLQELAAGRLAHYAALQLEQALRDPAAISEGVLTKHVDAVQDIIERGRGPLAPWLDVDGQLRAHTSEVAIGSGHRVFFSLPAIDETIGGVSAGEVCGLMGRPGIGKTVFLSYIARAVTENFGHVFFSLEMPGGQIVGRLKQMLYGLGRHELERSSRMNLLDDALYRKTFAHLVIIDTPSLSVREMGRRLQQVARGPLKNIPIRLITIDHLGLVGGDRELSTYDRVSLQAREIKELAKRAECGVVLAVQVNRDAGGDGSRELSLGSARDSGVVEEAMDYLIGIRRLDRSVTLSSYEREKYRDVIFAKVIKNRHGDPHVNEVAYRFNPHGLQLFEDRDFKLDDTDAAKMAAPRTGRRS